MANIELEDCTLHLPVFGTINRSLKGLVLSAMTGGRLASATRNIAVVEALSDVSINIRPGDRVGLLGHNGAGKTSLLKMMAGIYEPTRGKMRVNGRISNLLDVTMGLDFEATGEENVILRGLLHGLRRSEIKGKLPGIWEFSGLGDFMRMPVRSYSSGMLVRLAFSIATSLEAEILLMDEWLGVGDADFNSRAQERLLDLVNRSSILVLASHNSAIINSLCTRTIEFNHGRVVAEVAMPAVKGE